MGLQTGRAIPHVSVQLSRPDLSCFLLVLAAPLSPGCTPFSGLGGLCSRALWCGATGAGPWLRGGAGGWDSDQLWPLQHGRRLQHGGRTPKRSEQLWPDGGVVGVFGVHVFWFLVYLRAD